MPFRVIVVGGGVTGLTASHCLQRAAIDHVVLERRDEVAPAEGASIAIYPHGSRILHQIGCLEAAKKACVPCGRWLVRNPDGKMILDNGYFRYLEENHGSGMMMLERRKFLQILYDGLPDKTPIKTSSGVKDIRHLPDRMEVTLDNGTVEVGDVVIGCDGVYSATRSLMWDHANKSTPGFITTKEKTAIKTRWKSLIGVAPGTPELGQSDLTVVYNTRHSFLSLAQPDKVYFFFIVRVAEPFTWPKRMRYSQQDAEKLADSLAEHPVSDSMLFGELWRKRIRGGLVNLEEGVLDHWFHDRIVLAGDAAHKVTPNIGLGGNSGMESVVELCNHLQQMVSKSPHGKAPTMSMIQNAFQSYQIKRKARMRDIVELSSLITRVQAWDTPWHRFLATWALPYQPDRATADQIGAILSEAPKLNYVSAAGFPSGRLPWKSDEDKDLAPTRNSTSTSSSSSLLLRFFGAAVACMAVWHGARFIMTPALASTPASVSPLT